MDAGLSSRPAARPRSADAGHVIVNRAPVLTLWAAVVAERLGFDHDEARTMGRAVAGLDAHTKGAALGIFKPVPQAVRRERERATAGLHLHVELLHRAVPVIHTTQGWRALAKDKPIEPAAVHRYLQGKFGESLEIVEHAMTALADSLPVEELARRAFDLYERFRPDVSAGRRGWGEAGVLDIARIRAAAR